MNRRRLVGLVLALTLCLPASASALSGGAGTSLAGRASVFEAGGGSASAQAQTSFTGLVDGDGLVFVFECDAEAVGVAAAVRIDACTVTTGGKTWHGVDEVALPGSAVVTAGTAQVPFDALGSTVRACVRATVTPLIGEPLAAQACADEGVGVDPAGLPPVSSQPPSSTTTRGILTHLYDNYCEQWRAPAADRPCDELYGILYPRS